MSTPTAGDDLVRRPAGAPIRRWAREQALGACVYGAPGWFAVGDAGAVNVRTAAAVFACEDPDGDPTDEEFRVLVICDGDKAGWSIEAGPYAERYEAARVAQAVLVLAHDEAAWPPAEPLDTVDVDAGGDPVLFDV